MKVKLIAYTPDPERVVALAARMCYANTIDIETLENGLDSAQIKRLIYQLKDSGHTSTWEHVSFSFAIEGISRVVSHELVRHRIGCSYSQRSQRYCAEGECDFIEPYTIRYKSKETDDDVLWSSAADDIFWSSVCNSKDDYKNLLENNIPREDARYVLPNATATRMIVTMNARALLHFFNLRCCNRAMREIRELANAMLDLVKKIAPTLFEKAGASCVSLGYCPEGRMCCGRAPTLQDLKTAYNTIAGKPRVSVE